MTTDYFAFPGAVAITPDVTPSPSAGGAGGSSSSGGITAQAEGTDRNDGVYSSLEAGAGKALAEAAVGMAVFAGILVAVSSTKAYPLAYAMVGLALLYVFLEANGASQLKKIVDTARSWTGVGGKS